VREDARAESVADLPPATRVATSFPNLTTRHFHDRGREVTLVPLSGAAEIAPHLGVADVIVDLVSTGSTLRTNGLRELETVLESTALLVSRPGLTSNAESARELARLSTALESVLRARDKRYLMANVPRTGLDAARRILPGITGPTVVDLLDHNGHVAVHAVVDQSEIYRVIAELKAIGAEGILVTRIERLMP
jgi:ATP phosphoribosyltransferase